MLLFGGKFGDIFSFVQGITQEDAKLVDKHACWDGICMAKARSLWWTRQQHLRMLSPAFTTSYATRYLEELSI